jgi:hypothetical protein
MMRKIVVLAFSAAIVSAEFVGAQPVASSGVSSATASPPMRPPPAVCVNDPERHRFDFWIGEWTVTNPAGATVGTSIIES